MHCPFRYRYLCGPASQPSQCGHWPKLQGNDQSWSDFPGQGQHGLEKTKQCTECHHAPFTIWALSEGKKQGYSVDEKELADLTAWAVAKGHPCQNRRKSGQTNRPKRGTAAFWRWGSKLKAPRKHRMGLENSSRL